MALAASIALARPHESIDEGWSATALAVAAVAVLVMADQVDAPTLAVVILVAIGSGGLGHWRPPAVRALEPLLAALVAVAVVFATLPDTEGSTLLGAAIVPLAAGALLRRTAWRGPAAGAAIGGLAAATAVVAVDGAAGRTGSLVVAAIAGSVCAALVVLVARLLRGRPARVTSGRGRPSR